MAPVPKEVTGNNKDKVRHQERTGCSDLKKQPKQHVWQYQSRSKHAEQKEGLIHCASQAFANAWHAIVQIRHLLAAVPDNDGIAGAAVAG